MAIWDRGALVYPFAWAAVWPLVVLGLEEERYEVVMALAQRLLSPEQQRLPATIEAELGHALAAHRTGHPSAARARLRQALAAAEQAGYD